MEKACRNNDNFQLIHGFVVHLVADTFVSVILSDAKEVRQAILCELHGSVSGGHFRCHKLAA